MHIKGTLYKIETGYYSNNSMLEAFISYLEGVLSSSFVSPGDPDLEFFLALRFVWPM
jgi:hypothetical protein